MNVGQTARFWRKVRMPALVLTIAISATALAVGGWNLMGSMNDRQNEFVFYAVARSDLPIVVTERGNLAAQVETEIRCELESMSRDSSGNYGTQIIFIVPNGSAVEEGDLLIEMDSATLRERLDAQILKHKRAESSLIQAEANHENQILTNQTRLAEAELAVTLAEWTLEMYEDEENGTHRVNRDEILMRIDEANNAILSAQGSAELTKTDLLGIQELFRLGYKGQRELRQEELNLMKSESQLASAANKVASLQAELGKLDEYERKMQVLKLQGSKESSLRSLEQVKNDNKSNLALSESNLNESIAVEDKERERLELYEEQLTKCKIFAPHDGMVVYSRDGRSGNTEIAEGVTVRQRQRILTLPDLSRMQVKTQVHEAVLDQIKRDLRATIKIDAFPDETYYGVVSYVAPVPSSTSHYSSGVKTYGTTVLINDEVKDLKPGMTAVVEMHVERVDGILTVPVQSVVQRDKENWCYIASTSGVDKRMLTLGRSNDKFVHVQEGLAVGDRVVLNPIAIMEATESEEREISPEAGEPVMPDSVAKSLDARKAEIQAERDAAAAKTTSSKGGDLDARRKKMEAFRKAGGMRRGGGGPKGAPGGRSPR